MLRNKGATLVFGVILAWVVLAGVLTLVVGDHDDGQQAGPSPTSTLPDPSVSDPPADQDGGDPDDGELIDETSDPGQEFDPEQAGPAFQPRPNGLGDRTIRNEPQGPPLNTPKPPAPPSNPSPPPTTAPPRLAPPTTTPPIAPPPTIPPRGNTPPSLQVTSPAPGAEVDARPYASFILTGTASDDGQIESITVDYGNAQGLLSGAVLNDDGTWVAEALVETTGPATFRVVATDDEGDSTTVTVTYEVVAAPTPGTEIPDPDLVALTDDECALFDRPTGDGTLTANGDLPLLRGDVVICQPNANLPVGLFVVIETVERPGREWTAREAALSEALRRYQAHQTIQFDLDGNPITNFVSDLAPFDGSPTLTAAGLDIGAESEGFERSATWGRTFEKDIAGAKLRAAVELKVKFGLSFHLDVSLGIISGINVEAYAKVGAEIHLNASGEVTWKPDLDPLIDFRRPLPTLFIGPVPIPTALDLKVTPEFSAELTATLLDAKATASLKVGFKYDGSFRGIWEPDSDLPETETALPSLTLTGKAAITAQLTLGVGTPISKGSPVDALAGPFMRAEAGVDLALSASAPDYLEGEIAKASLRLYLQGEPGAQFKLSAGPVDVTLDESLGPFVKDWVYELAIYGDEDAFARPTNLVATPDDREITLTWDPIPIPEGSSYTDETIGYLITAVPSDADDTVPAVDRKTVLSRTATSVSFTGLQNYTDYEFRVRPVRLAEGKPTSQGTKDASVNEMPFPPLRAWASSSRGYPGVFWQTTITATGGRYPTQRTFSLHPDESLPDGLTLTHAGTISGLTQVPFTSQVRVLVTDGDSTVTVLQPLIFEGPERIRGLAYALLGAKAGEGVPFADGVQAHTIGLTITSMGPVTADGQGNVYASIRLSGEESRLVHVDPDGVVETLLGGGSWRDPNLDEITPDDPMIPVHLRIGAMTMSDDRTVLFVDDVTRTVWSFDTLDRTVHAVSAASQVALIDDLVYDPTSSTIWAGSRGNGTVFRVWPDGSVERVIGSGVRGRSPDGTPAFDMQAETLRLVGVTADRVYFTDGTYRARLRYMDRQTGLIHSLVGVDDPDCQIPVTPPVAQIIPSTFCGGLDAIGIGPDGRIYVVAFDTAMAVEPTDGSWYYVAGRSWCILPPEFEYLGADSSRCHFVTAVDMTIDPAGNMYVVNALTAQVGIYPRIAAP